MGIERALEVFKEEIFFKRPESVGTIRVEDIFGDPTHEGFQMAILKFAGHWAEDGSVFMRNIPKDFIKKDQIVEVWVRKNRLPQYPKVVLVSVRPFEKEFYGKYFDKDEVFLNEIFFHNKKDSFSSPRFFKRFLTTSK